MTESDVNSYFMESETYRFSGCVNIDKFKNNLGIDPGIYCAYQMQLVQKQQSLKSTILSNSGGAYYDFKRVARSVAVPDEAKRAFILQLFDLNPAVCSTKYAVGLKIVGHSMQQ